MVSCTLPIAFLVSTLSASPDSSWTQFRGSTGDGQTSSPTFPLVWNDETNIAWKSKVPGTGWSQPVVVKGKIFLTSALSDEASKPLKMGEGSSDRRSIFGDSKPPETVFRWQTHCFDLATGQPLWQQTLAEQRPGLPTHPSNTFATESPATDGERVFFYFGSIGKLAAINLDGKVEWEADLGVYPMTSGLGTGSSPVVHEGKVFIQCYNEENSFLVALDATNGKEAWRAKRANGTSWSTPFLWKTKDQTQLVACGKSRVFSYNPSDGAVLWELGGIVGGFASSPVGNAEMLVVGNNGPLSPAPLVGVKAGAKGDITLPKGQKGSEIVPWYRLRFGPGLSSPIIVGSHVYIATDSFLNCHDLATGERLYRERLPEARDIVASLWAAGENVFLLDEEGRTFIVKAGPKFELVGVNKISDTFWASAAVAGDSLLLRGVENLFCIRAPGNP